MKDGLPRLLPVLAWCAMVLLGVFFITWSSKPPEEPLGVVVGQKLPANFYFLTGGKTPANAAGRYVASSKGVDVGAVLRGRDLAERPAVPVFREPKLLLSAPVASGAILAGLNAGAQARICGKGGMSYGETTIRFVACDYSEGEEALCAAVVEASDPTALESLGKVAKDKTAVSEIHIAQACK